MRRMTTEVQAPSVPIYLAGEFVEAGRPLEIRNPAKDELVATTFQAGPDELERATVAAVEAFDELAGEVDRHARGLHLGRHAPHSTSRSGSAHRGDMGRTT